jgi:hypothetical protein
MTDSELIREALETAASWEEARAEGWSGIDEPTAAECRAKSKSFRDCLARFKASESITSKPKETP